MGELGDTELKQSEWEEEERMPSAAVALSERPSATFRLAALWRALADIFGDLCVGEEDRKDPPEALGPSRRLGSLRLLGGDALSSLVRHQEGGHQLWWHQGVANITFK